MVANNDKAVEISEKQFEETINSGKVVVVDFFAEWCMPCVMMGPVIEELAGKLKEVKFAKVNVDENSELAGRFSVSSIPCLVVFKEGKEVGRIVGGMPAQVLEEKIKGYV